MSQRIGLFTELGTPNKKSARTTSASYVDIETAKDLADKLAGLGAKKCGLLRRDRLGETHLEGAMLAPTDLKDEHLTWLTAKPDQFETRGVYYTR
jgi:hypothetical protein